MSKRKVMLYIGGVFILLFLVYNIFWYFGSYRVYSEYEKEFEEIADSGVKIYIDDEEYQYSVSKPTYLLWNGNLAIAEKNIKHALIIWQGIWMSNMTTGIMITNEDGETTQIEMKDISTAVNINYQDTVDENSEIILKLYDKAYKKWKLEIE